MNDPNFAKMLRGKLTRIKQIKSCLNFAYAFRTLYVQTKRNSETFSSNYTDQFSKKQKKKKLKHGLQYRERRCVDSDFSDRYCDRHASQNGIL